MYITRGKKTKVHFEPKNGKKKQRFPRFPHFWPFVRLKFLLFIFKYYFYIVLISPVKIILDPIDFFFLLYRKN